MLRECLYSLEAQTYDNFEVVVVEDGAPTAKHLVESFSERLNIRYFSTGRNVGRSAAGNYGLTQAQGEWLGFLDDDDLFLPNHVATLMHEASRSRCSAVYGVALEVPTRLDEISETVVRYTEGKEFVRYRQPFRLLLLWQKNFLPIQSVLFHRSLYERYGGFDEDLDQLEDWVLWQKYAQGGRFEFVDVITSRYRVPLERENSNTRQAKLADAYETVAARRRNARFELSPDEIMWLFEREFLSAPFYYTFLVPLRRRLYRYPNVLGFCRRVMRATRGRS